MTRTAQMAQLQNFPASLNTPAVTDRFTCLSLALGGRRTVGVRGGGYGLEIARVGRMPRPGAGRVRVDPPFHLPGDPRGASGPRATRNRTRSAQGRPHRLAMRSRAIS